MKIAKNKGQYVWPQETSQGVAIAGSRGRLEIQGLMSWDAWDFMKVAAGSGTYGKDLSRVHVLRSCVLFTCFLISSNMKVGIKVNTTACMTKFILQSRLNEKKALITLLLQGLEHKSERNRKSFN